MTPAWLKARQTKYSAFAFLYIAVILGVLVFANVFADRYDKSYDSTSNKQFSLSEQTIKIVNGDPTTHNIHPTPKNNREWNESQAPKAAALEKSFAREEILLPVKCNQHPWMKMFVNVVKNPFYAVSGPDGKFEIKGLPPGDYTLAFVQEKLGEQDQKVTLAAKDSKTVDVTFKP